MITVATAVCVLFAGWIDRTDAPRVEDPDATVTTGSLAGPSGSRGGAVHLGPGTATGIARPRLRRRAPRRPPSRTRCARRPDRVGPLRRRGGIVWLRPRRAVPWAQLVAVFVALDLGLMALTSQLTLTPPNDCSRGRPRSTGGGRHLAPGARMVNYDPQAYDSYPDSPQGVPDLNVIPRLPSVRATRQSSTATTNP